MKKKNILFCLIALLTLAGCSQEDRDEREAKAVYNSKSLTREEKIDKLYLLYCGSSRKANNKTAADRAWKAIKEGDYSKAYTITQGYKSDYLNYSAQYYAELLQVDMPVPNSFTLSLTERYYTYDVDYPSIKSNCPIDNGKIFYDLSCRVEGEKEGFDYDSFDTGSSSNVNLPKSMSKRSPTWIDQTVTLSAILKPYTGWGFDYYKQDTKFNYTLSIDNFKSTTGTFTFKLVE